MPEVLSNVPLPFLVLQACQAFELCYLQEVDLEVHQLLVQRSVDVCLPADTGRGRLGTQVLEAHASIVPKQTLLA